MDTGSGSASISASGTLTLGGSATLAPSGVMYNAGYITYTGSNLKTSGNSVNVSFSPTTVTLTNGTGGTVTVSNFVVPSGMRVSNASPSVKVYVGGKMTYGASSTSGDYTGNVQLNISSVAGNATINLPIILSCWQPLGGMQISQLNFGGINVVTGGSVVNVSPSTGVATIKSGAGGVTLDTSTPANFGQFKITGEKNSTVFVTLPSSAVLTGPNSAQMTVNNFSQHPSNNQVNLDNTGAAYVNVGADLSVGTNQAEGSYSGTYSITISY